MSSKVLKWLQKFDDVVLPEWLVYVVIGIVLLIVLAFYSPMLYECFILSDEAYNAAKELNQ